MLLFFLIYSFYRLSGSLRYDAFEEQEQKELGETLNALLSRNTT